MSFQGVQAPCCSDFHLVAVSVTVVGGVSSGGLLRIILVLASAASLDKLIHQISLGHFDLSVTASAAHWHVSTQGQYCQSECLILFGLYFLCHRKLLKLTSGVRLRQVVCGVWWDIV